MTNKSKEGSTMPTNEFYIDFNVNGAERKRLVQVIVEIGRAHV